MWKLKSYASLPTKQEIRQIDIESSRRDFWYFCKTRDGDFYKDSRIHLKKLCTVLNDFYYDRLSCKNLGIEMPPRHGKSRTLTNFSAWILGKSTKNRLITGSYNDDLAQDFSRYTRDIIQEELFDPDSIIYSDIFPDTKIKKGDASYKKWSLEGEFFNYKGVGVGGGITGKGGNWLIVDDPVKDAETAYNPAALAKIWLWYSGTFLSRKEKGIKKIVCQTPWMKGDLLSILLDKQPEKWQMISMPVYDGQELLCSELYGKEDYEDDKSLMDENIFQANYMMQRMDIKGRLYTEFKTYTTIPENTTRQFFYTDTADEGKDYLCSIAVKQKGLYYYVIDVIYTQAAQEITEQEQAKFCINNNVTQGWIESNNGGRAFARNVKRLLEEKGHRDSITWFYQSKNKVSRILTNAATVQNYVLWPEDWGKRWPEFYNALMTYHKEGKNKHDDAPDTLTGIVEKGENNYIKAPKYSKARLGL